MTDKIEIATVAITLKHPFWASLLFDKMEVKLDTRMPVAATDGKTIFLNPDNMETRTNGQVVFIMAHEIGHAMFRHCPRFKYFKEMGFEGQPFDQMLANIAADYVINAMLKECGVGEVPPDALLLPKYNGNMAWTEVYRDLLQNKPPPPKGQPGKGQGGGGGGSSQPQQPNQGNPQQQQPGSGKGNQPGSAPSAQDYADRGLPVPLDEHLDPIDADASNQTHSEEGWQLAIAAAANAAKAQGKLPAMLERFVDQLLEPQKPWQELLRASISARIGRDERTWRRPRRRSLVESNVYLPGMTGSGSGVLAVFVDTSGSIGQIEFDTFCGELQSILTDAKPEACHILFGDARVHSHVLLDEWGDARDAFKKARGGGGTDFRPFWVWLDEQKVVPDTAVLLTDTYGSYPDASPFPLIVCSTEAEANSRAPEFPHKMIHVELKHRRAA
jgi:predicted metal-dependent peptidase